MVQNVPNFVNTTFGTFCYYGNMSKNERLVQARIKAGYPTLADAANAFAWHIRVYRTHEDGTRGIRDNVARKYARAFGVSYVWLVTGVEEKLSKESAEVIDLWDLIPAEDKPAAITVLKKFAEKPDKAS